MTGAVPAPDRADDGGRLRRELERRLEGVEGWLHPSEAWELHESSRLVRAPGRGPTAVEIGSWKGRSTIALASGLSARGGGTLHAIDPLVPAPDDPPGGVEERFAEFLANLERAGVADLVRPLRETSHAARPRFNDRSVDVLFIDGDHDYAAVLQDIDDWVSAMIDGGIVAFNDPFWPGVKRALSERAGRSNAPFRKPWFVVNTVFFIFEPRARWTSRDAAAALRLRLFLRLGSRVNRTLEKLGPRLPRPVLRATVRLTSATVPRLLRKRMPSR